MIWSELSRILLCLACLFLSALLLPLTVCSKWNHSKGVLPIESPNANPEHRVYSFPWNSVALELQYHNTNKPALLRNIALGLRFKGRPLHVWIEELPSRNDKLISAKLQEFNDALTNATGTGCYDRRVESLHGYGLRSRFCFNFALESLKSVELFFAFDIPWIPETISTEEMRDR